MEPDENGLHPILTGNEEPELSVEEMLLPTRAQLEERNNADGNDSGDKSGGDASKPTGQTNEEGPEEGDEANGVLYQPTVADPGQFQPQDYSFEVTVFDDEGKNGKVKKIATVDEWDELLDTDPNLGSAASLLKAQRLATKMESKQDADKAAYDKAKIDFEADQAKVQANTQFIEDRQKELDYLVDKGELPPLAKKFRDADWSDPEVAKDPGVKAQIDLLKYMDKENKSRTKAGLKPFSSMLDAFNAMDRDNARKAIKTAATAQGEARRQASARVGGVTPGPGSNMPKGVMVGRSLGSLDNLG